MTREEFERLPFDDQVSIFLDSDLWNYSVCDAWEIIHTDEIPDRIEDGVIDTLREYGVADLYQSLDRIVHAINGHNGFVYWNRYDEWWDDMAPLRARDLLEIIDSYSDDEYYAEFFEAGQPEEEDLSFEGIEELIA